MNGERDTRQGYQQLPPPSEMLLGVRSTLGLSTKELAQMLNVSRSTIKRWRAGVNPSGRNIGILGASYEETQKLATMILPERIPLVICRFAEAFGGRRALDLILEGKLGDVRASYDKALEYQPD